MEIDDNTDEVLADIRLHRNSTSPHCRYTSTTVHNILGLDLIRGLVSSLLDIIHVVDLFLLLVDSPLEFAKRLDNTSDLIKFDSTTKAC